MAKDTRERMIEKTARLLQHRGYYGTSLSTILQESRAPRGSLYFHFPGGKDQLVLEATRAAVEETTRYLKATFAEGASPPLAVRAFFEAAAQALSETEYTFGCPVAPIILDASGDQAELAELCRQAFEEWLGLLQASFQRAGLPEERAYRLALLVESAMEGLLLIGRAYEDAEKLRMVGAELEAIVESVLDAQQAG